MFQRINRHLVKTFFSTQKQQVEKTTNIVHSMPHPVWNEKDYHNVKIDHKEPNTIGDKFAHCLIQSMRIGFDLVSGYKKIFPWQNTKMTENKWINRVLFLETVAGVPGFVAGLHRHLSSLRRMKKDLGWIHTLLEEAENERFHLLTFLAIKQPSLIFRSCVFVSQMFYVCLFWIAYMIKPRICHRVVGYLEEEAVKTYTHMIKEIETEGSPIYSWQTKIAPPIAIEYWNMKSDATLLEVVKAIRKDEEHHKEVNHKFADDFTQSSANQID